MIATVLSLYSLLLGTAIMLLGAGLLGTLLGVRAGMEGFSGTATGLIMSGYFVGYVFGAYYCPRLIRRFGHVRTFAGLAASASALVIVQGLIVQPHVWWLLRLLTGLCMVGLYLVIESWLNERSEHRLRGRVFASYMTVNLLAMGAGQFLLLIYGAGELASFALVALLTSFALVPIAFTRTPEPRPVEVPHLHLRRLITISPLGTTGALFTGLGNGAFWGLGPLFGHDIGLRNIGIASFMSAVIFGGALLQGFIGHQSDQRDRRGVLMVVCFVAALAAAAVVVSAGLSLTALVVSAVLFGGFSFSVYSLAVAHTNDQIEASEVLEATQGLLLLNGIGAALGPVFAGVLSEFVGPRSLFIYLGAVYGLLGLYTMHRMRVSGPIPVEEQAEFISMSRTSPAVVELDPRAEVAPELELVQPSRTEP